MNGLLICSGVGQRKNIGDYIQSLAQEQFFKKIDCLVEREHLDSISDDKKINLIMNGWFMWNPENFPPAPSINPLFISFHIVPSIASRFFSTKTIEYLKKHEPIGARDTGTQALLEKYGIESYFSGCLTLTLNLKYKSDIKDHSIYFVDPYYEYDLRKDRNKERRLFKALQLLIKSPRKSFIISRHIKYNVKWAVANIPILGKMLMAACFYETYHNVFGDDVLFNAKFISHSVDQSLFNNDQEKIEYARDLVHTYAKASLVVTSRIHCALPCLGIETPVIFISSDALDDGRTRSPGRFGGLINLFHRCRWTPKGLVAESQELKKLLQKDKIHLNNILNNSDDYKPLRDELIKKASEFTTKFE